MGASISFLFDSSDPRLGGYYGDPCIRATVKAVGSAASDGQPPSRILVGDVPLHSVAEQVIAFSADHREGSRRTKSYTVSANHRRLTALVWDLIDSVEEQWHTVILENHVPALAGNALFSVTWTNLEDFVRAGADSILWDQPGYVGALEVDMRNPVQREIFVSRLIDEAVVTPSGIWVRSEAVEEMVAPPWTEAITGVSITTVDEFQLQETEPTVVFPQELSAGGKRTLQILKSTRDESPQGRLLTALSYGEAMVEPGFDRVDLETGQDPALRAAEVPERKLKDYVLNASHPQGKHKAFLFKELLGIEPQDWRFLAAQLLRGLNEAEIHTVRLSKYGVKYSAVIPVVGRNGETKQVLSAWIAVGDQPPRLTSARIATKEVDVALEAEVPPVVSAAVKGDEHALLIYNAAVAEAVARAKAVVPTPIKISPGRLEREGECGYAEVRLPDARSSFVRWLKKNGFGRRGSKRGWSIGAHLGSQSLDRNREYAEGFAEILRLNGIECHVKWWRD